MTGVASARASAPVAAAATPSSAPSRAMSVWMIAAAPASSNRRASSNAPTSTVSAQPSTATRPSRASMPTAIRPGNARQASRTRPGSRTAAVPRITRCTPRPSHASMVAMSRMPPPSCSGMSTASSMAPTAPALTGLPANAPSRSTMWSQAKPAAAKARACAGGSSEKTVARAMSPCTRRTHAPPLRSMAGKRITAPRPATGPSDPCSSSGRRSIGRPRTHTWDACPSARSREIRRARWRPPASRARSGSSP